MSITPVGIATSSTYGGTCPQHGSAVNGDLLVCDVAYFNSTSGTCGLADTQGVWTAVPGSRVVSPSGGGLIVVKETFYKFRNGATGVITATIGGGSSDALILQNAYRGVDTTSPIYAVGAGYSGLNDPVVGGVGVLAGGMVLIAQACYNEASTAFAMSGYTVTARGAASYELTGFSAPVAADGTSPSASGTGGNLQGNTGSQSGAQQISLRPAAGSNAAAALTAGAGLAATGQAQKTASAALAAAMGLSASPGGTVNATAALSAGAALAAPGASRKTAAAALTAQAVLTGAASAPSNVIVDNTSPGNVPPKTVTPCPQVMRTAPWEFTWTPNYNSNALPVSVPVLLTLADNNNAGFYLANVGGNTNFCVSNAAAGALIANVIFTFSSGQQIKFVVDPVAGTVTISGATGGNGVLSIPGALADWFPANNNLRVGGAYTAGNDSGGTYSDITNAQTPPTDAAAALSAGLGLTASANGAVSATAALAASAALTATGRSIKSASVGLNGGLGLLAVTAGDVLVVVVGNSLAEGRYGGGVSSWAMPGANGFSALVPDIEVANATHSSLSIQELQALYASEVAPLYDPGKRCIIVFWEGVNQVYKHNSTALQTYNLTVTYCNGAKATGFEFVVCTTIPCDYPPITPTLDAYDVLLRNSSVFDGLIDFDLASQPGGDLDGLDPPGVSNPAGYYDDDTHLTNGPSGGYAYTTGWAAGRLASYLGVNYDTASSLTASLGLAAVGRSIRSATAALGAGMTLAGGSGTAANAAAALSGGLGLTAAAQIRKSAAAALAASLGLTAETSTTPGTGTAALSAALALVAAASQQRSAQALLNASLGLAAVSSKIVNATAALNGGMQLTVVIPQPEPSDNVVLPADGVVALQNLYNQRVRQTEVILPATPWVQRTSALVAKGIIYDGGYRLVQLQGFSVAGVTRYLQLFDSPREPAPGAAPDAIVAVTAGSEFQYTPAGGGRVFSSACYFALSSTPSTYTPTDAAIWLMAQGSAT